MCDQFNIGDVVKKKSGKPFQNGNKITTIIQFTTMLILSQDKKTRKTVGAVYVKDCNCPVRLSILEKVFNYQ